MDQWDAAEQQTVNILWYVADNDGLLCLDVVTGIWWQTSTAAAAGTRGTWWWQCYSLPSLQHTITSLTDSSVTNGLNQSTQNDTTESHWTIDVVDLNSVKTQRTKDKAKTQLQPSSLSHLVGLASSDDVTSSVPPSSGYRRRRRRLGQ